MMGEVTNGNKTEWRVCKSHIKAMTNKPYTTTAQAGFTLIEVIAVLVILAVLAAVAIPRYVDLIDEARDRALDGAVAAGLSHVSLAYGQLCLENAAEPTADEVRIRSDAEPPRSEDYSFVFTSIANGVNVEARETRANPRSRNRDWLMP